MIVNPFPFIFSYAAVPPVARQPVVGYCGRVFSSSPTTGNSGLVLASTPAVGVGGLS